MKTAILIILLVICPPLYSKGSSSCLNKEDIIRIDIKDAKVSDFNSLVDDISCICLKSGNRSSFDSCIKMARYNDYLYLMVRTIAGNKVVIYKNTGEFVKEITFSDTLLVSSLVIVPSQQQLWVVSRLKILNKFKLDGTLISRFSLPFPIVDLAAVGSQNFLVYDGGGPNNIENHHLALTDFKSIHNVFLKSTNKKKLPFFPQNMFAPDVNNSNLFIFPDCTDTIYLYNAKKEEVKPYYYLNFHGDFLTRDMYPDGGFSDKDMSDIITKRKYIYSQYCFYQASGRLFFKLAGKQDDFCTIKLANNTMQLFNSLFDGYRPTTYNPFIGSDGQCLYFIIKEKDLVKHYQKNKCTYPNIKRLLPSLSENKSNWIMLSIKIKNSL